MTKTTCPYCGTGCGLIISQSEDGYKVSGDPEHPANYGRICSKGAALADTLEHPKRLLYPQIKGKTVDWDTALDTVADGLEQTIKKHGKDSVAFYVSGQLLTEDYYLANKFMKGFIGSANIDTNSRLCMSSVVMAHKRAFGSDSVPACYEDLELADLIILVGTNAAWCHPVLYQRIVKAKKERPALKIIAIDPRQTQTTAIADLHLAINPGTDAYLFNGLLHYLAQQQKQATDFTEQHTEGLEAALISAIESSPDMKQLAELCGLSYADLSEFFQRFANTDKTLSVFSQGINQSSSGVDKINALINCHLFSGRIGREGTGVLSLTGQPNAMGGREVGGLANQLAAHMSIENPKHRSLVKTFWNAPDIPEQQGLKAVDLFKAIEEGKIKALWVMATNPAVSLPDSEQVKRALKACPLVIVSDCIADTDTSAYAHIKLPAQTWGEKNGTVTNSERRISRQRAFLSPVAQAKEDWWIIQQVAQRMGFSEQFNFKTEADIFQEHALLSAFQNKNERDFDLSALTALSHQDYEQLSPRQWPLSTYHDTSRLFADGKFYTDTGKAQFIAIKPRLPAQALEPDYPLRLNSGRVRDHWHTLTRTGVSARLSAHRSEPFIEINPVDAKQAKIDDQQLLQVSSKTGQVCVRARLTDKQTQGTAFMPIHWNAQYAANAKVCQLIPALTDPLSGQPEFKHTPINIRPYPARWYGFILSKQTLEIPAWIDYWSKSRSKNLWQYEIAGLASPESWEEQAKALLGGQQWLDYEDKTLGFYRAANLSNAKLQACLFIAPSPQLPSRSWLKQLDSEHQLNSAERQSLLSASAPIGTKDQGKTVCACFNVGLNTLVEAIEKQNLSSVEAIGECLQAGTQCGSCIPELQQLLIT